MKRMTIVAVGLALAAALPATPAAALSARTFVSGHGNDANPCNFSGPCRTFAAAYAKTAPSGEITVLDPAGYGPLTITTALSIVNDGVGEAGIILIAAGNAITITAGPSDAVSLRGLTIDGGNVGSTGIQFNSGKSLTVENCVVRHLTGDAIDFLSNGTSKLSVANTVVADNGNSGIAVVSSGSTTVSAVFNRVQANNNVNYGIFVAATNSPGAVQATVYDSVAAGNGIGFYVYATGGTPAQTSTLALFHSVASNNGTGLRSEGVDVLMYVAQSMVTGNTNGWVMTNGGVLLSYGDNYIDGNAGNQAAPLTIARK